MHVFLMIWSTSWESVSVEDEIRMHCIQIVVQLVHTGSVLYGMNCCVLIRHLAGHVLFSVWSTVRSALALYSWNSGPFSYDRLLFKLLFYFPQDMIFKQHFQHKLAIGQHDYVILICNLAAEITKSVVNCSIFIF